MSLRSDEVNFFRVAVSSDGEYSTYDYFFVPNCEIAIGAGSDWQILEEETVHLEKYGRIFTKRVRIKKKEYV